MEFGKGSGRNKSVFTTLIVYNASGTRELRRIPHVMFLPFVRKRLNRILETTSVTAGAAEEEEDDDETQ